jgi:hypothetical protein
LHPAEQELLEVVDPKGDYLRVHWRIKGVIVTGCILKAQTVPTKTAARRVPAETSLAADRLDGPDQIVALSPIVAPDDVRAIFQLYPQQGAIAARPLSDIDSAVGDAESFARSLEKPVDMPAPIPAGGASGTGNSPSPSRKAW